MSSKNNPPDTTSVNVDWTPGETGKNPAQDQEPTFIGEVKEAGAYLKGKDPFIKKAAIVGGSGAFLVSTAGTGGAIETDMAFDALEMGAVAGGSLMAAGAVAATAVAAGVITEAVAHEQRRDREIEKLGTLLQEVKRTDPALIAQLIQIAGTGVATNGQIDTEKVGQLLLLLPPNLSLNSNPLKAIDTNHDGKATVDELRQSLMKFMVEDGHLDAKAPTVTPAVQGPAPQPTR